MAKRDGSPKIEVGTVTEYKYVRKSEREIRELAMGVRAGSVYGSWMVRPKEMITNVFMCLLFMDDLQTKMMQRDKIEHVYSYMSEAGPLAINGMPIFYSMYMLTDEDCQRINEALKLIEEFMGGEDEG